MIKRRWLSVLAGFSVIGCAVMAAPSAFALNETTVYGIANFGHAGECEDDTSLSHSVHTQTAAAFAQTFNLLQLVSYWDEVSTRNNTSARGSYWTDASKSGSCMCSTNDMASNSGADEADVVYIHTHGWHEAPSIFSPSTPAYSGLVMGNDSYDCGVQTNQNMLFGNPATSGDLDIAVIKACQSGDYDVWKNGGYRQQITTSDSSMTMWNAFHGDSSCGSHVTEYVGDYSAESISNGVGENWLDEAYDSWGDDDCPVSIVFGSSSAARENMYEYGGWRDRKDTGAKVGSTIFFIGGCDPSHGRVLPD